MEYQRIEKNLRSELSTWTKKFEDKEINFIQLERKCEEQEETLKFFEQSVTEVSQIFYLKYNVMVFIYSKFFKFLVERYENINSQ